VLSIVEKRMLTAEEYLSRSAVPEAAQTYLYAHRRTERVAFAKRKLYEREKPARAFQPPPARLLDKL
jgi:hypothetical protein